MKERYEALKKRLAGDCLQERRIRVGAEIVLLFFVFGGQRCRGARKRERRRKGLEGLKPAFQLKLAGDDAAANKEKDQEKAPTEVHQRIANASADGWGCIIRRKAMASLSNTIRETRSHRNSHLPSESNFGACRIRTPWSKLSPRWPAS